MQILYSNGTRSHRMRVHVLAFNDDATATYISPPAGGEASVNATFTALAAKLAPLMNTAFTMSLDSYWHVDPATGVATETFVPVPPATVAGSSGTAASVYEAYEVITMRTTGGKPFRVYVYQEPGVAIGFTATITPAAGGSSKQQLVNYLQASTTAVLGHDGHKPTGNGRAIDGYNRKLRRKAGDA